MNPSDTQEMLCALWLLVAINENAPKWIRVIAACMSFTSLTLSILHGIKSLI